MFYAIIYRYVHNNKIGGNCVNRDKLITLAPQNVHMMGENGRIIDRFLYHRATSDAARHHIYLEAENALMFWFWRLARGILGQMDADCCVDSGIYT